MSDNTANTVNRMRVSAIAQEAHEQSARQDGDNNTMWQSTWSMMASINSRCASRSPGPGPALLDIDMHDLWHTYWHGAINTEPSSPKLDRLALQIVQAREQGILTQRMGPGSQVSQDSQTTGGTTTEGERLQATTSDGRRIWTDLPFLVQDMTAHWTNDCAAMSSSQRLSGAQFLGLLAAAGPAADDALCSIALVVLRETLETPRPLGRLAPTEANAARQMQDLSVADLLPAANAWLFAAGHKLVLLSDAERDGFPATVGGLGELVLSSPVLPATASSTQAPMTPNTSDTAPSGRPPWELPRHGGFSPQRWIWWAYRLKEIASVAASEDYASGLDEASGSLTSMAGAMMNNMLLIAEQTHGPVAQAAQRLNELVIHRPAVLILGPGRTAPAGTGN